MFHPAESSHCRESSGTNFATTPAGTLAANASSGSRRTGESRGGAYIDSILASIAVIIRGHFLDIRANAPAKVVVMVVMVVMFPLPLRARKGLAPL